MKVGATTTFTMEDYVKMLVDTYNYIPIPDHRKKMLEEETLSTLYYIINTYKRKNDPEIEHHLIDWQENGIISNLLNYIQGDIIKEGVREWKQVTPKIGEIINTYLRDSINVQEKRTEVYWFMIGVLTVVSLLENTHRSGLDNLENTPATLVHKAVLSLFFLMKLMRK